MTEPTDWMNKNVVVTLTTTEKRLDVVEVTGKVVAQNESGILMKVTNSGPLHMYYNGDIDSIKEAELKEKPRVPGAPTLRRPAPTEVDIFKHLLREHGYPRSWCNDTTADLAFEHHTALDHSDLGHIHAEG